VAKVSGGERQRLEVEHPTGFFTVDMEVVPKGNSVEVKRSALLRTARKLMRGRSVRARSRVEARMSPAGLSAGIR
jgi:4-oxalomesaconate tautomerase